MEFPLVMASRAAGHRVRKLAMRSLDVVGLYPGQEVVLLELRERGELNQAELAAALEVEPPTCTSIVTKLLRAGLVHRTSRGRENRIVLTEAGEVAAQQVAGLYADMERSLAAGLSTQEHDQILHALKHIARASSAALEELAAAAPSPPHPSGTPMPNTATDTLRDPQGLATTPLTGTPRGHHGRSAR